MKTKIFIFLISIHFTVFANTPYKQDGFTSSFKRNLNSTSHGYNIVKDPTGSAPTIDVEKFEVRAGDCSQDSVWSDCKNYRERSEIYSVVGRFIGNEEKYTWYMYMPQDWKDIVPASNLHGQFFQTNKSSTIGFGQPLISVMLSNRGLQIENFLKYKRSSIYDIDKIRGKWTKIIFHVKWASEIDGSSADGFYKVYVNDELLYEYSGNTVSSYGVDEMRFIYGIYRFDLNKLNEKPPTQIMYYTNIKREKLN